MKRSEIEVRKGKEVGSGKSKFESVPLADVCELIAGQSPPSCDYNTERTGLPFYQGKADFGPLHPVPRVWCSRPLKIAQAGDILISVRAPVGPTNVASEECCIGRGLSAIRVSERIDGNFLFHYFRCKEHELADLGSGSTFKAITQKELSTFEIPLPPLPLQKHIAAILDKADAIRRKRQQAIKLAADFLRATFLDMFGDPVTNPKGWEVVPLRKLGRVTTGSTPPRENPEYYGDDIEWIKSDNINTPYHYLTKSAEGLSELGKKVARTAPPGSTLVTCIAGSFECIGNAALTDREVSFNQQINAVTPHPNIDPFFVYAQILTGKKKIQNASTNSMKGMVSKGNFEEITLFRPPEDLQRKFGLLFLKYSKIIAETRDIERISTALFNSLAQRAFRGEL